MPAVNSVLRWGWVLGIALFAPAALPAGGGERRYSEIRLQQSSNFLLTENVYALYSSPITFAPCLKTLEMGTPIRILDYWESQDSGYWVRVKLSSGNFFRDPSTVIHGWLNV